jgi:hypothetical protein
MNNENIPNLVIFRAGDDFVECKLDEKFRLYGERRIFRPASQDDS